MDEHDADVKLCNRHDPELVPKALNETLKDLGVDYLDLYLMHWPVADTEGLKEIEFLNTWEAMTKLPKSLVRNIGVSNFATSQLTSLIAAHPLSKPYVASSSPPRHLIQQSSAIVLTKLLIGTSTNSKRIRTFPRPASSQRTVLSASK